MKNPAPPGPLACTQLRNSSSSTVTWEPLQSVITRPAISTVGVSSFTASPFDTASVVSPDTGQVSSTTVPAGIRSPRSSLRTAFSATAISRSTETPRKGTPLRLMTVSNSPKTRAL